MIPIDEDPGTIDDPSYYSFDLSGTYKVSAVTSSTVTFTNTDGSAVAWSWITSYFGGTTYSQSATFTNSGAASEIALAGQYSVDAVTNLQLDLTSPATVNADWSDLAALPGSVTDFVSAAVTKVTDAIVGPFILDVPTLTKVYCNFIALNGLYRDDGKNQIALSVDIQIELTPVNSLGVAIGATEVFVCTLTGSGSDRNTVAQTFQIDPTFTGRCSVKAFRTTPKLTIANNQIVDEVKWRDLYAVSPVTQLNFGDVTTVYAVTHATDGALAVKSRKLNMLVTRKLPQRVSGSTFTAGLFATNNAADILSAIALDPKIGNRQPSEVDFDSIYDTVAEVTSYFGTADAAQFCYTFDKFNLSFEETVSMIADAVFCTAYRRGNMLKLSFEKETDDSALLFNHRNKLPGTENRTVRFGNATDNDGIVYSYVSPIDDAVVNIKLPADLSAVNPKSYESGGVRSTRQAHFHANRLYNKMRYQNCTTEFVGLQEADLLVNNERILVADNTRPETNDGEVIAQVVLQLTLSQPFVPVGALNHTIFIQHYDGTVEAIALASAGPDPYLVVLATPPSLPLAIGDDLPHNATYQIVSNTSPRSSAFLLSERSPQDNFTSRITAINYDARYYDADKDFVLGLIP